MLDIYRLVQEDRWDRAHPCKFLRQHAWLIPADTLGGGLLTRRAEPSAAAVQELDRALPESAFSCLGTGIWRHVSTRKHHVLEQHRILNAIAVTALAPATGTASRRLTHPTLCVCDWRSFGRPRERLIRM